MTDLLEQLNALALLAAEITPGDWQQSHRKGAHGMYSTQVYDAHGATIASIAWHAKPIDATGAIGTYRDANAAFIAAARNFMLEHLPTLQAALAAPVAVGGAEETESHKLDAYRALVDSVVTSNSAPDGVKAWLKGVSEKIEADENGCEACEGTGREDVIGEWSCKWCDGTGKA